MQKLKNKHNNILPSFLVVISFLIAACSNESRSNNRNNFRIHTEKQERYHKHQANKRKKKRHVRHINNDIGTQIYQYRYYIPLFLSIIVRGTCKKSFISNNDEKINNDGVKTNEFAVKNLGQNTQNTQNIQKKKNIKYKPRIETVKQNIQNIQKKKNITLYDDTRLNDYAGEVVKELIKKLKKNKERNFEIGKNDKPLGDVKKTILLKLSQGMKLGNIEEAFKNITFKRFKLQKKPFTLWNSVKFIKENLQKNFKALNFIQNKEKYIHNDGFKYEQSQNKDIVFVHSNFANARVGGDIDDSYAQEEDLFLRGLALPIKPVLSTYENYLSTNEVAIFTNFPQFGKTDPVEIYRHSGKILKTLATLKTMTPNEQIEYIDLLCIHAPCVRDFPGEYSEVWLKHIFCQIYCACDALVKQYPNAKKIIWNFGNFGGGAFANNLVTMYSVFLLAALVARINNKDVAKKLKIKLHLLSQRTEFDQACDLVSNAIIIISKNDKVTIKSLWDNIKLIARRKKTNLKIIKKIKLIKDSL